MSDFERRVVIIPARPQAMQEELKRQKRVAAYCRVSTEEEEQQSSYEAQCSYYTDKIMTNPEWTMAGIFADEGITGTSTKKREEFNRMIRKCRQKKIDLILTKSISRFARNTVDCLKYVRVLKELGIGIYFEKENINTLDMDTELLVGPPFDSLYLRWLEAQIDYHNGEYDKFNAAILLFNTAWREFENYYRQTHTTTGSPCRFRF